MKELYQLKQSLTKAVRGRKFQEENSSIDIDLEVQSIINSISEIEKQLDQIEIQKAEFSGIYTDQNPVFKNLLIQEQLLKDRKIKLKKLLRSPSSQQNYLDLFRSFDATQKIYMELLNQRLNYSIQEASTIGNIRVIDQPYIESSCPNIFTTFSIYLPVLYSLFLQQL